MQRQRKGKNTLKRLWHQKSSLSFQYFILRATLTTFHPRVWVGPLRFNSTTKIICTSRAASTISFSCSHVKRLNMNPSEHGCLGFSFWHYLGTLLLNLANRKDDKNSPLLPGVASTCLKAFGLTQLGTQDCRATETETVQSSRAPKTLKVAPFGLYHFLTSTMSLCVCVYVSIFVFIAL